MDLIDRQQALDILDDYSKDVLEIWHGSYETARKKMCELQSVRSEIIRCKDCKKRMPEGYCTVHVQNIHGLATAWYMPDDEDFCSKAERKTDG